MSRRRFKRTGLRQEQNAEVVKSLGVARLAIGQVMLNYDFGQAEYQAACAANTALIKLGETLGQPDDSMWRDGAKVATAPEKKER